MAENEVKHLMTTNKQIMVQNVKSIRNLNEKIAILRKMLIKSDVILTRKQSNYKIELKIIELKLNYWIKPKKDWNSWVICRELH